MLTNKRILLGVTGGIAAYKSADLVRRLREAGGEVRVVMTRAAGEFITPLTLQALSGNPVHRELLDAETESAMGHIDLARWADAIVVAPASADFIARLAHGRADDLLAALCLATDAPIAVAPAMNRLMWANAATQENVATIARRGVRIFGPGEGDQACGETGPGRMLEPADIATRVGGLFESGALSGQTVLITAGPTFEALDPVRGLTNRSSGKMGYALAEAARDAGARVTLVSGPVALTPPDRIEVIRVTSAPEMFDAVMARAPGVDIFIGVAAVADYRPATTSAGKIKKDAEAMTVALVRNPDILASVAALRPRPFMVGFAAETGDLEREARKKLVSKGADLIIANDATTIGADDAQVWVVSRAAITPLERLPKTELARRLIAVIAENCHAKNPDQDSRLARR
jgi:phosphopantothenoylcysteine decarboxylase/phosphopantothenate--cysteine ligase